MPLSEDRPIQSPEPPFLFVDQERVLSKAFSLQPYPNKKERRFLATEIHATEDQVKLWFRKRRVTQKNQLCYDRQRAAKLAYLNSLAHSLLLQPQQPPSPRQTRPQVPYSAVPFVGYRPSPYSRPRVVSSLYCSFRVRPSPYTVPKYPVNLRQCYYWYYYMNHEFSPNVNKIWPMKSILMWLYM